VEHYVGDIKNTLVLLPNSAKEQLPHRPYNDTLDIKDDTQPPWGAIYALTETELQSLQ